MSQIFSPNTANRTENEQDDARKRCQSYEEDDSLSDPARPNRGATDLAESEVVGRVMQQSQWKIRTDFKSKRSDYDNICSICLADPKPGSSRLITPCLCAGSRSHQHERCIETWIEQTGAASCPFCSVRYEFTRQRKSFVTYVRENHLEHDVLVHLAAFAICSYLFLVGSTICFRYLFATYSCDRYTSEMTAFDPKMLATINSWPEFERIVECHRSLREFSQVHSWPSMILLCLVCITTVLMSLGIVSTGLNIIIRHYVKYMLWSKNNFRVSVRPYRLDGPTSAVLPDGLQAWSGSV